MDDKYTDNDPIETQEWRDSISAVIRNQGMDRAQFLLKSLINKTTESGQQLPVIHSQHFLINKLILHQ